MSRFRFTQPGRPIAMCLKVGMAAAAAAVALPSQALVINANFDPVYNAVQKAAVNAAIATIAPLYSDNVTVNIDFGTTPGLGSSNQSIYGFSYATVYNALKADRTTSVDNTAVASLGAASDVLFGTPTMWVTHAQCAALGLNCAPSASDGTIGINLGLVDADRSDGIAADKYDMRAVVMHEIDEILGSGGPGSLLGGGPPGRGVEDLFRYTQAGARTFTTAGDDAYFSYDGGATRVARFNQDSGGDYADFWSTGAHTPQVQDAFGTPGVVIDYGSAERTILDVVGWNLVSRNVPEPGSLALTLAALLALRPLRGARARQK